jgi:hypothetical protein
MDIDRILNIYQAYSITKISAINKQMLIAQYAQCEKINAIQKQLDVANSVSRRILENQLKEIQQRETQKYYKNLAFKMSEAFEKIISVTDINLQTFLCSIILDKLLANIKECQTNLEEIRDKEYCRDLINKCNTLLDNISIRHDYLNSSFYIMQNNEQDYNNKVSDKKNILKAKRIELNEKKYTLKNLINRELAERKTKRGCSMGCLVIIGFILIMFLIAQIGMTLDNEQSSWTEFTVLETLLLVSFIFILRYHRKQKNKNIQYKNKDKIDQLQIEISNVENEINSINNDDSLKNHTYIISKQDVEKNYPDLEVTLTDLMQYFPMQQNSKKSYDKLIRECAEFIMMINDVKLSAIQRRFSIGYNRVGKIVEQLVELGVIKKKPSNNGYIILT